MLDSSIAVVNPCAFRCSVVDDVTAENETAWESENNNNGGQLGSRLLNISFSFVASTL